MKSQASTEFMLLVGGMLFIFAIVMGAVAYNTTVVNRNKFLLVADSVVSKIQKEVNLAARVVDGYVREFTLPEKLLTKNYSISIEGKYVIIHADNQDFWKEIPNVTGTITKGINIINKTNGTIYIN